MQLNTVAAATHVLDFNRTALYAGLHLQQTVCTLCYDMRIILLASEPSAMRAIASFSACVYATSVVFFSHKCRRSWIRTRRIKIIWSFNWRSSRNSATERRPVRFIQVHDNTSITTSPPNVPTQYTKWRIQKTHSCTIPSIRHRRC